MLWIVLHEPFEHAIMVALDKGPRAPCITPGNQCVKNSAGVRPPVGVVPQKHDGGIAPAVSLNEVKDTLKFVHLAVDVANNRVLVFG